MKEIDDTQLLSDIHNFCGAIKLELYYMYNKASRFKHFKYTENGNTWTTREAEEVYNNIIIVISHRMDKYKMMQELVK